MELKELREEINSIDVQIEELFQKRMDVSAKIADYKKERGLPTRDPKREAEVLDKHAKSVRPELSIYAYELFEKLIQLSRDYQNSIR